MAQDNSRHYRELFLNDTPLMDMRAPWVVNTDIKRVLRPDVSASACQKIRSYYLSRAI